MYPLISVAIMALVTYIPRALPIAFFHKKIKSRFVKSFLYYVPYAVLSALTFPSIFYCTGNFYTALIGTVVSLVAGLFNMKLIYVVLMAVLVVFGFSFVF